MIFDLKHSFPLAVRILKEELGLLSALRCLLCFGWRKIWQRPFKPLASQLSNAKEEVLTRHQLEPMLLLEAALSVDLKINKDRTLGILRRVVRESGARFIQFAVQSPSPQEWRAKSIDAKNEFCPKRPPPIFQRGSTSGQRPGRTFCLRREALSFRAIDPGLGPTGSGALILWGGRSTVQPTGVKGFHDPSRDFGNGPRTLRFSVSLG